MEEDMVPLLNYVWDGSFGNIPTNKRELMSREWNPVNRNLLLGKETFTSTNTVRQYKINTTTTTTK
jgi:hypothetical protein